MTQQELMRVAPQSGWVPFDWDLSHRDTCHGQSPLHDSRRWSINNNKRLINIMHITMLVEMFITLETCLLQWSFSCVFVCWVSNHIPAWSCFCTLRVQWCSHRWPLHLHCACNHGRPDLQRNTHPMRPLSQHTSHYPDGCVPDPHRNKPWNGPSRPR